MKKRSKASIGVTDLDEGRVSPCFAETKPNARRIRVVGSRHRLTISDSGKGKTRFIGLTDESGQRSPRLTCPLNFLIGSQEEPLVKGSFHGTAPSEWTQRVRSKRVAINCSESSPSVWGEVWQSETARTPEALPISLAAMSEAPFNSGLYERKSWLKVACVREHPIFTIFLNGGIFYPHSIVDETSPFQAAVSPLVANFDSLTLDPSHGHWGSSISGYKS